MVEHYNNNFIRECYRRRMCEQIEGFQYEFPNIYIDPILAMRRMYYMIVTMKNPRLEYYGLEFLLYNLLQVLDVNNSKIEPEYNRHLAVLIRRISVLYGSTIDDVDNKDDNKDLTDELIQLGSMTPIFKYVQNVDWGARVSRYTKACAHPGNYVNRVEAEYMDIMTELYLFNKYKHHLVYINTSRYLCRLHDDDMKKKHGITLPPFYARQLGYKVYDDRILCLKNELYELASAIRIGTNDTIKPYLEERVNELIYNTDYLIDLCIDIKHLNEYIEIDSDDNIDYGPYTVRCVI